MILTEENANKKMCIYWAITTMAFTPSCKGSDCMAWKWIESEIIGCCGRVYPTKEKK